MKLYFNGCSHASGEELKNPKTTSWPALIANAQGADFENFAMSGGSNDRIKYLTLKHHADFDKFYIAWTYTGRFTRYRNNNHHHVNFNPMMINMHYGNMSEFQLYGKLHYAHWHSELYAFKLWLQDIIFLQRFFESIKKPYVMINATNNLIDRWTTDWKNFPDSVKSLMCCDHMDDHQLFLEHNEIQSLVAQIDFSHYIGWNTWWITKLTTDYAVGPNNHLLEKGNQAVALHLLKYDTN
jgi:hypothetical protein